MQLFQASCWKMLFFLTKVHLEKIINKPKIFEEVIEFSNCIETIDLRGQFVNISFSILHFSGGQHAPIQCSLLRSFICFNSIQSWMFIIINIGGNVCQENECMKQHYHNSAYFEKYLLPSYTNSNCIFRWRCVWYSMNRLWI